VTTVDATDGTIHLAPGFSDSGTYTATARASDGSLTNDKGFQIIVSNVNRVPVLAQPANVTVNLVAPGTTYGDRVNQFDMRIGKIFRFGQRRASVNLDIYNLLNSSAVLTESQAYGTFRVPQIVIVGRFVKVSTQVDF